MTYKLLFKLFTVLFFTISIPSFAKALTINTFLSLSDTTKNKEIILNEEVVIVGMRYPDNSFNRHEAIFTLNNKQLAWGNAMSTPDAMAMIPGVWMQKTNHGGGSPFMRGLTGYQTLLMIDGIRLNNATFRSGPNQYLNTIDPWMLERIEVQPGHGSVAYGTDAIGGTALLLSKDPAFSIGKPTLSGNLYSKFMTGNMERTFRAETSVSSENIAFIGGITSRKLGDIKAGGDLGTLENTGYEELNWDAKLKFKLNDKHLLTLAHQHVKQQNVPLYHKLVTQEYDAYSFDPQQRDLAYVRLASFYDKPLIEEITYTVSWQRSLEIRKTNKRDSPQFVTDRDEVNTTGMTVEATSRPAEKWRIASGIDFYHDNVASRTSIYNEELEVTTEKRGLYPNNASAANFAVYTLHTYEIDRFIFTGGARWNYFKLGLTDEQFGDTELTPSALVGNVGINFKLSKVHHLVTSLSTAFRAPNINDVSSFGVADFRYEVPNYNLAPEKSINLEFGYKLKAEQVAASFFVFRSKLTDLIINKTGSYKGETSIDGNLVYQRTNAAQAYIQGFETNVEWSPRKKLVTYAFLAYTYGQNLSENEPLRRIPPLNGRWGIRYGLNSNWYVQGDLVFASAQNRLSGGDKADNRIADGGTPAWQIVNLTGGIDLPFIRISTGLQNIFNKAYRTHGSGIDGIGRSLWVSATAKF